VIPVFLASLASSQASWLAARQTTIASNVANANTPGYQVRDVTPFSSVLDNTSMSLASTHPAHINPTSGLAPTERVSKSDSWEVFHSGNSVALEQEMMKAGQVNQDYALNTSIVKAFHRMVSMSAK
jgi:flagellar basal-body rod protein FlgB